MRSQLGGLGGRSVDVWSRSSGGYIPQTPSGAKAVDLPASSSTITDTQAIAAIASTRPDLALAIQRLAGMDPEQRQAQYEAIRLEVLQFEQKGTLNVDLNADSGGGSAYERLPEEAQPVEEGESPAPVKPFAPQTMFLQAYQQVSRTETPTSLLSFPSA